MANLLIARRGSPTDTVWQKIAPNHVFTGLHEDIDYLLDVGNVGTSVFVDDEPLVRTDSSAPSIFGWRPCFYAGRVVAEVVRSDGSAERYLLDVSPSESKSGQAQFDQMIAEIRTWEQALLSGEAAATMEFGHEGQGGRYHQDILLSRMREYGPRFMDAVEGITRSPHRFIVADRQVLPLSRVRRLHYSALQDRRLAAIATGKTAPSEAVDSFQIRGLTSTPTFDTPANRTLLALMRRFHAVLGALEQAVHRSQLGSDPEEQSPRAPRRLSALAELARRTKAVLDCGVFREVSSAEISAAGLTQIAAQPPYSRAYRLGSRALSTQVEGSDGDDQLHVPPSWGIYETWCFLAVSGITARITGSTGHVAPAKAVTADRAVHFDLPGGEKLEVLFQGKFPSLKPSKDRLGWSLSRERRPDILLVHHRAAAVRSMVIDAKWRSGPTNVLDAMASAHIYHDSLRIGIATPSPCVIALPGLAVVPTLDEDSFVRAHEVGAVSEVCPSAKGIARLERLISEWLDG